MYNRIISQFISNVHPMVSLDSCAIASLGSLGKFVASQNGLNRKRFPFSQDRNLCCEDLDWSVTDVVLQMFVGILIFVEFVFSGLIQVNNNNNNNNNTLQCHVWIYSALRWPNYEPQIYCTQGVIIWETTKEIVDKRLPNTLCTVRFRKSLPHRELSLFTTRRTVRYRLTFWICCT